jgi:diguanylate cyclase (GGDEF)-like protein
MGAHAVRAYGLLELLWQLVEANQALQRFCFLDGLTGIANRRRFEECLDLEWRRALRDATCLSVIMVDIDDFKIYNDTHGHRKGDQCLQRVAGALSGALRRPGDLLARYGGEEFVVLLCPGTHARGAAGVGKALRTRVEDLGIPRAHSRVSDRVTVSGGVATMVPRPGSSPAALVAAADQVLYQAKRAGRNRVRISPLAERGSR